MVEARIIGPHPALAAWADAAAPVARALLEDAPRRAGGTWAVGLDLLPNDQTGAIAGTALPWHVLGVLPESRLPEPRPPESRPPESLPPESLHRAQLSTVYPGYPRSDPDEPETANRYRLTRDAAHLDGLLPIGPDKRRMVKEPHGWILGIALTDCPASPLVVWPGSAALMRAALLAALTPHPPETWGDLDVTDAYQTARRRAFDTCPRVELPIRRGQATLLHRLTLHGVAPWRDPDQTDPRIIAYFRPQLASVRDWLTRA